MSTTAAIPATSPAEPARPVGFRTFLTVWAGQTVSETGSGLTSFALGVWVYQRTGSITMFAWILAFSAIPLVVLLPVAGSVVDRFDRRMLMIASDTAGILSAVAVALLAGAGRLEVWHVYVAVTWGSLCTSIHRASWSSSISLLVPKDQLGRTAGLTQLNQGAAMLFGPMLGGVLIVSVGLRGVILVDAITFLVGASATALVRIPRPPRSEGASNGLFRAVGEGWRYTISRAGLLQITYYLTVVNLAIGFVRALLTPMVLSFTTADRLGLALSAGAVGMISGALMMSTSGGPARRVRGMVLGGALMGVALLALGAHASVLTVAAAFALTTFAFTLTSACSTALLQASVPPEMQGRVFTTLRMIAWTAAPVAYILAGPLVDNGFTPLADRLRGMLGAAWTHAGGGPALLIAASGAMMLAGTLWLQRTASVRTLDEEPDAAR